MTYLLRPYGRGTVAQEAEGTSDGPLVNLEDVNKYFGELHVLKDIDLTVPAARSWS